MGHGNRLRAGWSYRFSMRRFVDTATGRSDSESSTVTSSSYSGPARALMVVYLYLLVR